jgi:excisionase family DNA binding protein
MMKPKELTIAEAAVKLGVRIDYLGMLVRSGKLAARKEDGRWFIPAEAVERRLQDRAAAEEATV